MASLREVRDRIGSVSSTQQITKAMKMVAAAKLRRAQDSIIQLRPYASKLSEILQRVASGVDASDNVYGIEKDSDQVLIVVITSDRGLCGSFNANVQKRVISLIEEKYPTHKEEGKLTLLCIGKKGFEFFEKRGFNIIKDYVNIFHNLSFDKVKVAAEQVMNSFLDNQYAKVEVVYNEFKNVATQIIEVEQFLPLVAAETEEEYTTAEEIDYIFEPSKKEIVEELIPKSLKLQFYKYVLESNASEHGARMTAMDKATDNAGDLLKELNLVYNRTRQAAITTEILEIVGGAEALAQSK